MLSKEGYVNAVNMLAHHSHMYAIYKHDAEKKAVEQYKKILIDYHKEVNQ